MGKLSLQGSQNTRHFMQRWAYKVEMLDYNEAENIKEGGKNIEELSNRSSY